MLPCFRSLSNKVLVTALRPNSALPVLSAPYGSLRICSAILTNGVGLAADAKAIAPGPFIHPTSGPVSAFSLSFFLMLLVQPEEGMCLSHLSFGQSPGWLAASVLIMLCGSLQGARNECTVGRTWERCHQDKLSQKS